jgi:hypothetical protein
LDGAEPVDYVRRSSVPRPYQALAAEALLDYRERVQEDASSVSDDRDSGQYSVFRRPPGTRPWPIDRLRIHGGGVSHRAHATLG